MAAKQFESQNRKKRAKRSGLMDKELDDSLQEIKNLLIMNTWVNFVIAKEKCITPESEEELAGIHKVLDAIISKWTFQQELK